MNAPTKPPRADVEIVTLGCRLNAYESEAMRALAGEAELSNAVIINTCAVKGEAVRQARPSYSPRAPRAAGRGDYRHRLRRSD